MKRVVQVAAALVVAGAVTTTGYALADIDEQTRVEPGVQTVEIGINHSRFSIDELKVRQGTVVRFVVRNDDPINHELIVGGPEVHRAHEGGTELFHPPVPGEVSVGPDETGLTAYRFDKPGTIVFACHLPRHLAYGMRGEIAVEPAQPDDVVEGTPSQ
jgi:uncharacterized cupredoxin-like copper-binding protein